MSRTDDNSAIEMAFDLQHPPEKVWRALTDPQLLAQWLLPSVGFELAPGAEFVFTAPPQPGWDGSVNCRLLELDVGRKLSLTWVVGDLDTVVTFALSPMASGTRLSITHTGFKPHQQQNRGGARYGWKMMGARLLDLLGRES